MTEQAARPVSTVISLIIFKYGLLIAVFSRLALTRAPKGPVPLLHLPSPPPRPAIRITPPTRERDEQRRAIYRPGPVIISSNSFIALPLLIDNPRRESESPTPTQAYQSRQSRHVIPRAARCRLISSFVIPREISRAVSSFQAGIGVLLRAERILPRA